MRKLKLMAMMLILCMALSAISGCAGNTPETTTEEPTTTTTAAPTSTPTPTHEPTSTPTPTPCVDEWVIDEKLVGTWAYEPGENLSVTYTFNDDNTGLLVQTVPTLDMKTKEQGTKTTETEIKYSIISEGVIRIITNDRYVDYEYKFVKKNLQLEDVDHYSKTIYKKK